MQKIKNKNWRTSLFRRAGRQMECAAVDPPPPPPPSGTQLTARPSSSSLRARHFSRSWPPTRRVAAAASPTRRVRPQVRQSARSHLIGRTRVAPPVSVSYIHRLASCPALSAPVVAKNVIEFAIRSLARRRWRDNNTVSRRFVFVFISPSPPSYSVSREIISEYFLYRLVPGGGEDREKKPFVVTVGRTTRRTRRPAVSVSPPSPSLSKSSSRPPRNAIDAPRLHRRRPDVTTSRVWVAVNVRVPSTVNSPQPPEMSRFLSSACCVAALLLLALSRPDGCGAYPSSSSAETATGPAGCDVAVQRFRSVGLYDTPSSRIDQGEQRNKEKNGFSLQPYTYIFLYVDLMRFKWVRQKY